TAVAVILTGTSASTVTPSWVRVMTVAPPQDRLAAKAAAAAAKASGRMATTVVPRERMLDLRVYAPSGPDRRGRLELSPGPRLEHGGNGHEAASQHPEGRGVEPARQGRPRGAVHHAQVRHADHHVGEPPHPVVGGPGEDGRVAVRGPAQQGGEGGGREPGCP